jgi:hypothetical protein
MTNGDGVSGKAITNAEQVTPEWLTAVLRREGVLERGEVVAVNASSLPHLALTYSPDAPAGVPASLYLKFGRRSGPASAVGHLEVAVYRALAPFRDDLPMLLRCYDAALDTAADASHLLLTDFSATHGLPGFGTLAAGERDAITDCTARFHAYWWEHPRRELFTRYDENIELDCADAASYMAYVARYQEAYPYFADFTGEELPPDERALYETLLAALPSLWPRYLAPRFTAWDAITLVQGDSHWGQFALPRRPTGQGPLMFDLECLHWGLPAAALAYRIPLDWTPNVRRVLEPGVIARYLAKLEEYGVNDYSHERFWQDYRLSTAFLALYPLKRFTARFDDRTDRQRKEASLPAWWWGVLEFVLENYQDMRCADLLT